MDASPSQYLEHGGWIWCVVGVDTCDKQLFGCCPTGWAFVVDILHSHWPVFEQAREVTEIGHWSSSASSLAKLSRKVGKKSQKINQFTHQRKNTCTGIFYAQVYPFCSKAASILCNVPIERCLYSISAVTLAHFVQYVGSTFTCPTKTCMFPYSQGGFE